MSISLENVTDSLLRTGLLTDTQVSETFRRMKSDGKEVTGEGLIKRLAARGKLTPFQARRIRKGRGLELLMGNYLILGRLGEGGMGIVYKALHRRMQREVALKILKKDISESTDFVARFQREVYAAARLNHPNVVAAYDADECDLGYFLVMEYVDGLDLSQVIHRAGPLSVREVINAIRQAAEALAYAHSQGVVHRDIKPSNLMRDVNGIIKLADLGLARIDPSVSDVAKTAALTEAGSAAGTIDYMAPEQAIDATKSDHRADIYSLGCTLYYLLAGQPIFDKSTLVGRIMAHREAPAPSLMELNVEVPTRLNDIYLKMVAKLPEDRHQTMQEVVEDLQELTDEKASYDKQAWIPDEATIVIVESSKLQSGMIGRILNQIGADDIHVFATGQEALDALALMPPDVVLASIELPDISGVELAQRIRDDVRWSQLAIVLMSSSELPDETATFIQKTPGMQAIRKPFDVQKLNAAINAAFQDERRDDAQLSNLAGLQVLVVDDSSVALRHMQSILKQLGFAHFTMANDGTDAVEQLTQNRFDLVVTDYNMPGMNGHDLIVHIRQQSSQSDIPIIMCTTEFDPERLAEVYQLGVSAICNKSFEIELVRNIVIRLFQ